MDSSQVFGSLWFPFECLRLRATMWAKIVQGQNNLKQTAVSKELQPEISASSSASAKRGSVDVSGLEAIIMLPLERKVMTNLDSILKGRDSTLPTKVPLGKAMVFPVVMYGCESWTVKKAEHWRIDAFELWCWRRLLSVPWTARRSNQSILKISPGPWLNVGVLSWDGKTGAGAWGEMRILDKSTLRCQYARGDLKEMARRS